MRPTPNPGVLAIEAYEPGKSAAPAGVSLRKLSSNETPLGPSPRAIEAARAALAGTERYPDGQARALKEAIGAAYGLPVDRLLCGNGSDELLGLLCQCYLSPGDEAIHTEHGFLVYRIQILASGATPVVAPETNRTADVDAILAAVTERTKLVFLANPNNPTGTYLPVSEIRRLHAGLPDLVILVLDAAYAEYVRAEDYEAGIALAREADNVVMTRTFSKVHGLAGLRIGWLYGPADVVDAMNRVRGPFNMNAPAIAAGAASLADAEFIEAAVEHNARWLDWTANALAELGLEVTPSVANFLLVHFPDEAGRGAADADAFLTARGLILRRVAGYGFPNALRLSIGTEADNRAVVAALSNFLKGEASA